MPSGVTVIPSSEPDALCGSPIRGDPVDLAFGVAPHFGAKPNKAKAIVREVGTAVAGSHVQTLAAIICSKCGVVILSDRPPK